MNGCRQEALTINMAREHAATPRRKTGGEDDRGKARSCTGTQKKQIAGGKSTATALALAGNSTPALTHTSSRCRQSAGERIRPSTQETHTLPAVIHQWARTRRDTPPPSPVQSHGQRDTATAPQPTNNAHGASNHPKSRTRKQFLIHPRRGASLHAVTTQRPTPSGRDTRPARCLSPPFASCPREKAAPTRFCHTHRK
ncbi:hypothetical protein TcG_02327, partial [Trypanosoma cruzi]